GGRNRPPVLCRRDPGTEGPPSGRTRLRHRACRSRGGAAASRRSAAGMTGGAPTILATSGGWRPGRRTRLEFAPLAHHAVDLSGAHGRAPKVCHLGTAGGDQRHVNAWITEAAQVAGFQLTHLDLFPMPAVDDVEAHLLDQA